jgi:hypothetical protein
MAAMIPALFSPRSLLTSLRDYRIGEFALPEEGSVLRTESGPRVGRHLCAALAHWIRGKDINLSVNLRYSVNGLIR